MSHSNFNIGPSLTISPTISSPVVIYGVDQRKRDLTCRLLAEGYSSKGIPCILFTDGNRFSGLAKPNCHKANSKKLNRGFPTSRVNTEKLLEKDFYLSIDALGAEVVGATILCSFEEQEHLRNVFAISREQQRELISFHNLQSSVAWIIQNINSLPSWHGDLDKEILNQIQEKLLFAISCIEQESFGPDYFPLEQFYKKDYSDSGFINVFDTQLSSKGIQFALLPMLGILKKLAESSEQDKKLTIIISEPRLSRNYPAQMLTSVLKLLSLHNVKVHFCFTGKDDVDYRLLDLSKQIINSDTATLNKQRSQSKPFNTLINKRVSIQINREASKEAVKSLSSKIEKTNNDSILETISGLFKKTFDFYTNKKL